MRGSFAQDLPPTSLLVRLRLGFSAALLALVAFFYLRPVESPDPDPTDFRGIALGLFASTPEYDYGGLVREIAEHGASEVLLVLAWFQKDRFRDRMAPHPRKTPSDRTLRRTIRQAKASGLRVSLMPLILLEEARADAWRGRLAPAGGGLLWFAEYQRRLTALARLAQQEGIDRLGIGSELSSLESYTEAWKTLIRSLRQISSTFLFYSANWDHLDSIGFASDLDAIGVTAYLPMADDDRPPSDAIIEARWRSFFRDLHQRSLRWKRPIFLSEIGYPALASAARYPWDETTSSPADPFLQTRLWRLFCQHFPFWKNLSRHRGGTGFFAWNWFGFGGPSDTSFCLRGKPAASLLRTCGRRGSPSNGLPPTP